MNEQIIEGEATAIAIREDDGVVRSPMTPAQARERWEEFKAMRAALAEPGDWTEFRDRSGNVKRTPNKALIKKLAFAFRISMETVENRTDTLPDGHLGVTVRARATHSATGLSCEALAGCSSMEDRFRGLKGRAYHDIVATAETRATDRAIMNLIGGGEVGTDEMMASSKPAKAPPEEKPRGLTILEARARKENGGGGPVGVAEAGCSECHAPAGKQHATRCSRKRAETWDAEAESRDPSPSGERRAADVKTAADDARRAPAPSEDPKTTTSEARPPADEIRGISEAQRGLFFATLANTPLADDRELRHSWYEEIGVPGTSAAWSRDDFDKALAAADLEARRALASRKAAR